MINACFAEVPVDQMKFLLALGSFSISILAIFLLKTFPLSNKRKIPLIYTHLAGLFFPFVLFSTNMVCGFLCMPCFESPAALAILALPTTLLIATVAGFVVIPGYYMFSRKSFLVKNSSLTSFVSFYSKKLRMKPPSLYVLDISKPLAFSFRSFRSAIVLSVGLLDILTKRETEAVLLHEISHIKEKSSVVKLSSALMRFSPFSFFKNFHADVGMEEERADGFVREIQGTARHLLSAQKKIDAFGNGLIA